MAECVHKKKTLYIIICLIPPILFLVFTSALFAFFGVPLNFGEYAGYNIYSLVFSNLGLGEITRNNLTALFVFALMSALHTISSLSATLIPKLKSTVIETKSVKINLTTALYLVYIPLYIAVLIFAWSILGGVGAVGMSLSFPISFIIFASIICAAITFFSLSIRYIMGKLTPSLLPNYKKEYAAYLERRMEIRELSEQFHE